MELTATCTDRPQPSCSRPDGTPLRAWDRAYRWVDRGTSCEAEDPRQDEPDPEPAPEIDSRIDIDTRLVRKVQADKVPADVMTEGARRLRAEVRP